MLWALSSLAPPEPPRKPYEALFLQLEKNSLSLGHRGCFCMGSMLRQMSSGVRILRSRRIGTTNWTG